MTKMREVYKCEICGNITEVLHTGGGELVCCGAPMVAQNENTVDADKEKHVPVIKKTDSGVKIMVGEVAHPMEEDHYIEWIEMKMIKAGKIAKKYFKPGDAPEIECPSGGKDVEVRAYCNLHGLWKA